MLQRVRRFAIKLHKDETGPNTVEWVLLIIVALIVLVAIYVFIRWVIKQFQDRESQLQGDQKGAAKEAGKGITDK